MADALAGARAACLTERGMAAAIERLTADNGHPPTAVEQVWIEVGVHWGVLATLKTLHEVGWITGPG